MLKIIKQTKFFCSPCENVAQLKNVSQYNIIIVAQLLVVAQSSKYVAHDIGVAQHIL